jgi:hypothetical protein
MAYPPVLQQSKHGSYFFNSFTVVQTALINQEKKTCTKHYHYFDCCSVVKNSAVDPDPNPDPYSMGSLDRHPDSKSESGFRRGK